MIRTHNIDPFLVNGSSFCCWKNRKILLNLRLARHREFATFSPAFLEYPVLKLSQSIHEQSYMSLEVILGEFK